MPSTDGEIALCSGALGQIGEAGIGSLDDSNPRATWCRTYYPTIRRALLRLHHWNFAEARAALTANAVPPAFGFAAGYKLPSNLLKIKEFNGSQIVASPTDPVALPYFDPFYWLNTAYYKIEGRDLLTNYQNASIIYVFDETDVTSWDPLFYQACETWLASKLAASIRKNEAQAKSLKADAFGLFLPMATAVDGQEGTIVPYRVDDLLWGR